MILISVRKTGNSNSNFFLVLSCVDLRHHVASLLSGVFSHIIFQRQSDAQLISMTSFGPRKRVFPTDVEWPHHKWLNHVCKEVAILYWDVDKFL